jgi:hypothetical protein
MACSHAIEERAAKRQSLAKRERNCHAVAYGNDLACNANRFSACSED